MAAARKLKAVPPLKKVLDDYPYTMCREQHHWTPYDGRLDEKHKQAFRIQKCANCPTLKKSVLSLYPNDYGQLIRSTYLYPKDYKIVGGIDAKDLGRMRMANFLSEIDGM
jgi:hypothetical protein